MESKKFAVLTDLSLHSLKYQCDSEIFESVCDALAEVYYTAVKAFGGDDATPGKRSSNADWVAAYEEKLASYNQMLEDAMKAGTIPSNTTLATSRVAGTHHAASKRATLPLIKVRGRRV